MDLIAPLRLSSPILPTRQTSSMLGLLCVVQAFARAGAKRQVVNFPHLAVQTNRQVREDVLGCYYQQCSAIASVNG